MLAALTYKLSVSILLASMVPVLIHAPSMVVVPLASPVNVTKPFIWMVWEETVTPPTLREIEDDVEPLDTLRVMLSTFCVMLLTCPFSPVT